MHLNEKEIVWGKNKDVGRKCSYHHQLLYLLILSVSVYFKVSQIVCHVKQGVK